MLITDKFNINQICPSQITWLTFSQTSDKSTLRQIFYEYIGLFVNLEKLECIGIDIEEIHANLTKLEYLDISRNKVSKIPSTLINLKTLIAPNNELTFLPRLDKLVYLDVNCNNLKVLDYLPNLRTCYANYNKIECISNRFSELYTLEVARNKLAFIPLITSLVNLSIAENRIRKLPQLNYLETLHCPVNRLEELPVMHRLKTLVAYQNNIKRVELDKMKLERFVFFSNPMEHNLIYRHLFSNTDYDDFSQTSSIMACTRSIILTLIREKNDDCEIDLEDIDNELVHTFYDLTLREIMYLFWLKVSRSNSYHFRQCFFEIMESQRSMDWMISSVVFLMAEHFDIALVYSDMTKIKAIVKSELDSGTSYCKLKNRLISENVPMDDVDLWMAYY